jgi:hypothetical protein
LMIRMRMECLCINLGKTRHSDLVRGEDMQGNQRMVEKCINQISVLMFDTRLGYK